MHHIPVLLKETIDFLKPAPGKKIIDATFGAGGHSKALLDRIGSSGEILGIDANLDALDNKNFQFPISNFRKQLKLVHGNFREIEKIARENNFEKVDGVLMDLGLSSDMLDDPKRGFSFQTSGPLDMRFDQSQEFTAGEILKTYKEQELVKIFKAYGEDKFSKRIARVIIETRKNKSLKTTDELFALIKNSIPGKFRHKAGDSARRIFQALRIAVNQELGVLQEALPQAFELLAGKGRLVVISFHSLEDRIVKYFFRDLARGCVCPPDFPKCVCGKLPLAKILTKKPITASRTEVEINSRAIPAKLRAIEKI